MESAKGAALHGTTLGKTGQQLLVERPRNLITKAGLGKEPSRACAADVTGTKPRTTGRTQMQNQGRPGQIAQALSK